MSELAHLIAGSRSRFSYFMPDTVCLFFLDTQGDLLMVVGQSGAGKVC